MHFSRRRKARLVVASWSVATMLSLGATASSAQGPSGAEARRLTVPQAAAAFGARASILGARLSPDGTKLATVESDGPRGSVVKVIDLVSAGTGGGVKAVPIALATGDPERMDNCHWAGVTRLLCDVYGSALLDTGEFSYFNRIVALDADGKNMQTLQTPNRNGNGYGYNTFGGAVIDWNTGTDGHVMMIRQYFPQFSTGNLTSQKNEGLGVDDVDSANLKTSSVEKARAQAQEYISDGVGNIRVLGVDTALTRDGYSTGKTRYFYRTKIKKEWLDLSIVDKQTAEGFDPYFVDPQLDVAYGLDKHEGRLAAFSMTLDGMKKSTLLLARPDVDIDGFVTIGRNRRVVGITYTTDRGNVEYIDPQMKRLATALSKALPNLPLIRIVDSSQDERKLLIWAGSDVDPGRYYLLDRNTNGMIEAAMSRLPLARVTLAQVKHINFPARDGTQIPAYLTLPPGSDGKNLPAIVLPHGGPSSRDEWGFDWLSQFWAQIGYAVLQPEFRGSSGYGDAWFQKNGFQSWRTAIGDVTDSGKWLVSQGIADPKKLAIFGWSYGGYAALQAAVTEPDLFRAAIAVAPVTDLRRLKEEGFRWSDYKLTQDFIGSGPHVDEGSPARQAARIKVPVLMFHGTYDRNVKINQSELMAARLKEAGKDGRLVIYDKLDHYLEDSIVRQDMLQQSADFFTKAFAAGK
jgi:dipeptidyl aminopeptidase/acylaminoacyl peptidase